MNDQPREPAAPPPPSPAPATADDKAGGGLRALAVLLSLVLAFGAAVMIVASGEIADTPTLGEIESGEEPVPADNEYYDGSETSRSVSTGLGYASGIVGGVGVLLGIAFAITGRRGRLFVQAAIVAVVLAAVAILV